MRELFVEAALIFEGQGDVNTLSGGYNHYWADRECTLLSKSPSKCSHTTTNEHPQPRPASRHHTLGLGVVLEGVVELLGHRGRWIAALHEPLAHVQRCVLPAPAVELVQLVRIWRGKEE